MRVQTGRLQTTGFVLFAMAAGLLVALGAWWFTYITDSIDREQESAILSARQTALLWAARVRMKPQPDQAKQLLAQTQGMFGLYQVPASLPVDIAGFVPEIVEELVPYPTQPLQFLLGHAPPMAGPQANAVMATPKTVQSILERRHRRRSMVFGEGGLLLLLLTAVLAMLWRLVQAERRFRMEMSDFLGRVTHEMKTPLAGIKAVLQTIESGRMPPEQLGEIARLALRECEREEHLVQNILLAQKMRLPDQRLAHDVVQLRETLARFVRHRTEVRESVPFELNCPEDACVDCDPAALWTILENLTDNAIKYGANKLIFQVQASDKRLTLMVTDDGRGFEPSLGPQLFQAFVHASSGAPVKGHGTGLGLYLSRRLAQRMGGDLSASSQGVGSGATFSLVLPRANSLTTKAV